MKLTHRIAAGGLIFSNDKVVLVRYPDHQNSSFLVAPGGGLEEQENIEQAIIREVKEETGLIVKPNSVVMVEDLIYNKFKMIKIWMTCDIVEGVISKTQGAVDEGIIEVGWYNKEQLENETVYPSILLEQEWDILKSFNKRVKIPFSRRADF